MFAPVLPGHMLLFTGRVNTVSTWGLLCVTQTPHDGTGDVFKYLKGYEVFDIDGQEKMTQFIGYHVAIGIKST